MAKLVAAAALHFLEKLEGLVHGAEAHEARGELELGVKRLGKRTFLVGFGFRGLGLFCGLLLRGSRRGSCRSGGGGGSLSGGDRIVKLERDALENGGSLPGGAEHGALLLFVKRRQLVVIGLEPRLVSRGPGSFGLQSLFGIPGLVLLRHGRGRSCRSSRLRQQSC